MKDIEDLKDKANEIENNSEKVLENFKKRVKTPIAQRGRNNINVEGNVEIEYLCQDCVIKEVGKLFRENEKLALKLLQEYKEVIELKNKEIEILKEQIFSMKGKH